MTGEVLIVHCVDTEGPLYESLEAKFQRLEDLFGVAGLDRSEATLEKLRRGEIPLGGREAGVKRVLDGHLVNYNETWTAIDSMLDRIMAPAFRESRPDSYGQGWVFNWFCMDHVNFAYNPRRRDVGYHNIFDHYAARLARAEGQRDGLHWHFHPMSSFHDAHRCATHYLRSPEIFEILTRKVIERGWFPSAYRAGFQAERPDSHWFLEQWIPFDISNMAVTDNSELDRSLDFRNGRSGDWRRAPADWSIYRPSHDDYQSPGACRRHIARCLNVMNRIASVDQEEMDKAFARAGKGETTLVGVAGHDWRDLGTEVEFLRDLIDGARARFPGVPVRYCEVVDAFRRALPREELANARLELELTFHPAAGGDVPFIEVKTVGGKVFGPQPFLAIETRGRQFLHDNFDFSPDGTRWFYAFHEDTLSLSHVARIGVAASDGAGEVCVRRLDLTGV